MSNSVWPLRRQPTRLPRPWDSPGKNTGVGCHFLLQCMKVKSESEVAQSWPTLSDLRDCTLPGSSVYGIFQARVLEWAATAFSKIIYYIYSYNQKGTIHGFFGFVNIFVLQFSHRFLFSSIYWLWAPFWVLIFLIGFASPFPLLLRENLPFAASQLYARVVFTWYLLVLEKEMATHSSVLAWRIPGTGEPYGLPSMGSHRVGHDWSDLAAAAKG